jgi:hypothetical protein
MPEVGVQTRSFLEVVKPFKKNSNNLHCVHEHGGAFRTFADLLPDRIGPSFLSSRLPETGEFGAITCSFLFVHPGPGQECLPA